MEARDHRTGRTTAARAAARMWNSVAGGWSEHAE